MDRKYEIAKIQHGKGSVQTAKDLGISYPAWTVRKRKFLAGKITKEELIAPKHVPGCKDDPLNRWKGKQRTNKEMARILKISETNWGSRKYGYRHGQIDEEVLYYIGHHPSGNRKGARLNHPNSFAGLSDKVRTKNLLRLNQEPEGQYDFLAQEPDYAPNYNTLKGGK